MIAEARDRGLPVSADVSAHQLHLNENHLGDFSSNFHLDPPLRTQEDMLALRKAIAEGWIEAICSDHQPHEDDAKRNPFGQTEPGIAGLETLMSLALLLSDEGMPIETALTRLTHGPARILSLNSGTLVPGSAADVCIFDSRVRRRYESASGTSRGKNTPFDGWELPGRVTHTLVAGRLVYQAGPETGWSAA